MPEDKCKERIQGADRYAKAGRGGERKEASSERGHWLKSNKRARPGKGSELEGKNNDGSPLTTQKQS